MRVGYRDLSREMTLELRTKVVHKQKSGTEGRKVCSKQRDVMCTGSREGGSMVCKGDEKKVSVARAHPTRGHGWKSQGLHKTCAQIWVFVLKAMASH